MKDGYLPLANAAQNLGLSWGQAWRLVLMGELDGEKSGGRWMVSQTSVLRHKEATKRLEQPLVAA